MFRAYAILYEVEIIEIKDPDSSIKDLFSDLLNETKGFKYQITVKVLLKKYKLSDKNSNKSQIWIRKFFSRNFVHD